MNQPLSHFFVDADQFPGPCPVPAVSTIISAGTFEYRASGMHFTGRSKNFYQDLPFLM